MASNKSIASPAALLLFLAVALVFTATSVHAQPPAPTTMPARAPSPNPCPRSRFSNPDVFSRGFREYLRRSIPLILSTVRVTPGTSTTSCFCYFSTNVTIPVPDAISPIVLPNYAGPLECVPGRQI